MVAPVKVMTVQRIKNVKKTNRRLVVVLSIRVKISPVVIPVVHEDRQNNQYSLLPVLPVEVKRFLMKLCLKRDCAEIS